MKTALLAKTHPCTCITPFCTFLSRRCTTTTWKCVISRFVGDGNTRQQLPFSFHELWCSPLEFNSKTFANIWWIKRDGISAITFEAARIHFLRDVFVAVAVVVASHAGVFRGARFSSLPTNACSTEDNIPFPSLANHIVLSKFWKSDNYSICIKHWESFLTSNKC